MTNLNDDPDRDYPTTEPEVDYDNAARALCVILVVGLVLVLCILMAARALL